MLGTDVSGFSELLGNDVSGAALESPGGSYVDVGGKRLRVVDCKTESCAGGTDVGSESGRRVVHAGRVAAVPLLSTLSSQGALLLSSEGTSGCSTGVGAAVALCTSPEGSRSSGREAGIDPRG